MDKIDRIRRANAWKHIPTVSNNQHTKANNSRFLAKAKKKTMPCIYYNQGSCSQSKSRETKVIFYRHICSACFANDNKAFPHPEQHCRNKLKSSKKRVMKSMENKVRSHVHTLNQVHNSRCFYNANVDVQPLFA